MWSLHFRSTKPGIGGEDRGKGSQDRGRQLQSDALQGRGGFMTSPKETREQAHPVYVLVRGTPLHGVQGGRRGHLKRMERRQDTEQPLGSGLPQSTTWKATPFQLLPEKYHVSPSNAQFLPYLLSPATSALPSSFLRHQHWAWGLEQPAGTLGR